MRALLHEFYEGDTPRGRRFRIALFAFDLATLAFVVATSFVDRSRVVEAIDVAIGVVISLDLAARFVGSPHPARELLRLTTWTDALSLVSFLLPLTSEGAGFLRVLRTLRLLRVVGIVERIEGPPASPRMSGEAVLAVANLLVFIFVMTGVVFEVALRAGNPDITNYADALYFTVTALTTTGFGDITLGGTVGRMISVLIMIFGVTLFLRLAQVLFRPNKVRFPCPACGLQRHDPDAVHCKACGTTLAIPDEGE
jgi:voltage-gated potassium channel